MTDENQSFLNEVQKFGKASDKIKIENLDEAISNVANILIPEEVEKLRNTPENDLPKMTMQVYCHDCREIVPAGIGKTLRGRPRAVCGKCKSRKISKGREEALKKFYHLD